MKPREHQQQKAASSPAMAKSARRGGKDGVAVKAEKKVRIVTPPKPKWRARHSLKAGRGVLKSLQPHAANPKLLVGAGSPRSAAIKAGKKTEISEFFRNTSPTSHQPPPSPPPPSPCTSTPHSPPRHDSPPHGIPPHSPPPHGTPPHSPPRHDSPPHGTPPHSLPRHDSPPHSSPPHSSPPHSPPPHTSQPHTPLPHSPSRPTSYTEQAPQTTPTTTHSLDYRMCTEDPPPMEYWQVLAEQRRLALVETLTENEELHTELHDLRSKVTELEDQVQYFALMYQLASSEPSP